MNKQKRTKLREADSLLTMARHLISCVKDREQDDLDSYPENLQGSERYTTMENAIDELEDAMESIDRASESINNAI